jgi:hypothetical protein
MKTTMKRTVLIASLFAAGSLLAYGPGFSGFGFPGHHGWSGHVMGMGYGPVAFLDGDVEARLDKIKTELAITPEQGTAWNRFANGVLAHADSARTAHEVSGAAPRVSRYPVGDQARQQLWQQRQAVHEAASNLIDVLDEAQRDKAARLIGYGVQHPF